MGKSVTGRDVSRRWTPLLMEGGWTPISDVFLRKYAVLKITSAEAMLIIQLMQHKWDENLPFPTFATLSTRMGMTETAARAHARNLEKKGFLKRIHCKGKANRFDLSPLFMALENAHAPLVSEAETTPNHL